MHHYLGLVQNGRWQFLSPTHADAPTRRLTAIARQDARSPESGELDLSELEGSLVYVEGDKNDEWIYSAQIIDQCDMAMSAAVLALLKNDADLQKTTMKHRDNAIP